MSQHFSIRLTELHMPLISTYTFHLPVRVFPIKESRDKMESRWNQGIRKEVTPSKLEDLTLRKDKKTKKESERNPSMDHVLFKLLHRTDNVFINAQALYILTTYNRYTRMTFKHIRQDDLTNYCYMHPQEKIKVVLEMPTPTDAVSVRRFIGFTNYLNRLLATFK